MSDSLLARIASEVPGEIRPETYRILCLYCCRVIESDVAKSWLRIVAESYQVQPLLAVKYYLDDSAVLNNIWRAIHELSYYKRPPKKRVIEVALEHGLDPDDVFTLLGSLNNAELNTIGTLRTFLREPYSDADINYVVGKLKKHLDNVAHQRLRYVANNDYSRDHADLMAELRSHAIRLIRRYEIEAESFAHMINLVGRGISNHGTNLAVRANRKSRKLLQRLVEKPSSRQAWWLDTKTMSIKPVKIEKKAKRKLKSNKKLCCEVCMADDGTVRYAQVEFLFENRREALHAKFRHRRTGNGQRRYIMDLSPPIQNDYIPTTTSLDRPIATESGGDKLTLAEVIPDPTVNNMSTILDSEFIKVLNQEADRVVREFTGCVLGQNRFFMDHLEKKGLDHCTLDDRRLGVEACRFLGCRLNDVKESLRNVPQKVWSSDNARNQVYTSSDSS